MISEPQFTILGGGLAGALLAVYFGQSGYSVNVYEKRSDPRLNKSDAAKSINLALSTRGLFALEEVGLKDLVLKLAIPMRGRMIHDQKGAISYQPYGTTDEEVLYSVSRAELNNALLSAAEKHPLVQLFFNKKCSTVDLDQNTLCFADQAGTTVPFRAVIGADGAFSQLRYQMQKLDRFDFEQYFLPHGYKELTIPPGTDGKFLLNPEALHIWPRGDFMLIALPNPDHSFTCTLFCPYDGDPSFAKLTTPQIVRSFFETTFPDALPLMPTLNEDFFNNPTGTLVTIRCSPWVYQGKAALVGDACHAVVPFYGQGMNAAFEDCSFLLKCLKDSPDNLDTAFRQYYHCRKLHTDTLAKLSMENYIEMRAKVASPLFLLWKHLENYLHEKFPRWIISLHGIVSFTRTPYHDAVERVKLQNRLLGSVTAVVAVLAAAAIGNLLF